jgi:hypothetical protein
MTMTWHGMTYHTTQQHRDMNVVDVSRELEFALTLRSTYCVCLCGFLLEVMSVTACTAWYLAT